MIAFKHDFYFQVQNKISLVFYYLFDNLRLHSISII